MKRVAAASNLRRALELCEPVLASMRLGDDSELFLDVVPGLTEEMAGLVQDTVGELVSGGWLAGRRGRITKTLVSAAGRLQQARNAQTYGRSLTHLAAAYRHLRRAAIALSRRSSRARR